MSRRYLESAISVTILALLIETVGRAVILVGHPSSCLNYIIVYYPLRLVTASTAIELRYNNALFNYPRPMHNGNFNASFLIIISFI